MAFFLIVPSVIIVTIFLVHSAAERLGFKAKYSSLILCAVMALLVNFAAIEMSTYLNKWYYLKLGVLVLIASVIVTLVNRYLIRHEKSDIVIIDDINDELAFEEVETKTIDTIDVSPTKPNIAKVKEDKSKSTTDNKSKVEDETEVKVTVPPKFLQREPDVEEITKPLENKSVETKISGKIVEVQSDTKVSLSEKVLDVQTDTKSTKVTDVSTKASKKAIGIQQSDTTKSAITTTIDNRKAEIKQPLTQSEKAEEKMLKPIEKKEIKPIEGAKSKQISAEKVENTQGKSQDKQTEKTENKLLDINSHLGSLDDILDYAYAQKTNGDLKQAILAYQKALDRYRNDDYAPFIAIDLGNIYKEQAAYSKVIKTYEEALKLPVVMRNADTRKEFNKNLSYMRIVQSVLVRHRALTMPFSKIPKQYLQEVETEFKSLQLNHSTVQKRY